MKYSIIFMITGCICTSLCGTNNSFSKFFNLSPSKSLMYNFTVAFLKTCELKSKKIIIYNNGSEPEEFSSLSGLQPRTSVSLISIVKKWNQVNQYRLDGIEVDAVIIVIQMKNAWTLMSNLFYRLRFQRDCIVYILPVPSHDCAHYKKILDLIMGYYLITAYYICLVDGRYTRVYTHDPYGDTEPPHWNIINQEFLWGKNWTFYERSYDKDMSELCPGFYFERTDPTNARFVIIGLYNNQTNEQFRIPKQGLLSDKIEQYLISDYPELVHNLKRLLKLRFIYLFYKPPSRGEPFRQAYDNTAIDAFIFVRGTMKVNYRWNLFYPVRNEPYAIISHNRGFMTPLEKIAKFYGVWTLSSLTFMLTVAFIVIWLATKNISLATFDVIRLLINTGVIVPISTCSRKIFLSMIFFYFLIIHATFSGHLAEFLTSVDNRDNIDTIEDLFDPRVEKTYYSGYRFDETKKFDVLRQKSEHLVISGQCSKIKNQPNSACIATLSMLLTMKERNDFLYISKNTLGQSWISNSYRSGFPLYEKFNLAIMYLFDTSIINRAMEIKQLKVLRKMKKQSAMIHVDWRSIRMDDLYFAFILLIVGYCVGFVCFFFEIGIRTVSNKLKNRQKNRVIVVSPI